MRAAPLVRRRCLVSHVDLYGRIPFTLWLERASARSTAALFAAILEHRTG